MSEDKKHSSFAVAIHPEFDEKGKWTGIVSANLEEEIFDDFSDDEITQLRSVTGMLAGCLQLMERDPEFLEYVKDHFIYENEQMVQEMLDALGEDEETPKFTRSEDGNVITLNFNTKTYGNA
jgi:hypothetical protein